MFTNYRLQRILIYIYNNSHSTNHVVYYYIKKNTKPVYKLCIWKNLL